ncbi:Site-specific recombinase XerD [Azospirillaceae bacterium]
MTTPECGGQVIGDHLAAEKYAQAARSKATRRAYQADLQRFAEWCKAAGATMTPAEPEVVAAFLAGEARQGMRPSTLERRRAAIRYAHERAGCETPTNALCVRETMAGIRRSLGVAPVRKTAATVELLEEMLMTIPDNFIGMRDRALLLIGFAGAFRRSELVALTVNDMEETAQGLLVTIRRGKTDQEGRGRVIAILRGKRYCPVSALRRWLAIAGIIAGPLFRTIGKGDRLLDRALSDHAVALIVKRYAAAAGLDSSQFAGHSLRRGFLTSAAMSGASVFKMREISGHASMESLANYVEAVDRFREHAGEGLL